MKKSNIFAFVVVTVLLYFVFLFNQIQQDLHKNEDKLVTSGKSSYFTFISGVTPTIIELAKMPTSTEKNDDVSHVLGAESINTEKIPSKRLDDLNSYRVSKGLSPIQTDTQTCKFAETRAIEASTNFSHEGFEKRKNDGSLPYPGFAHIVENIAMTTKGNPVEMWANSPTHEINMRADVTYGCIGEYNGYYVFEGWKP